MGLLYCYQCKKKNCANCMHNPSGENLEKDLADVKIALSLPRNTFPITHKSSQSPLKI